MPSLLPVIAAELPEVFCAMVVIDRPEVSGEVATSTLLQSFGKEVPVPSPSSVLMLNVQSSLRSPIRPGLVTGIVMVIA